MVETIHLAHIPRELEVYASLYKNVENTSFLKEQLLAGNKEFEYAFIDASTVLSRAHVLAATFRALNDHIHARLRSHNIHSEIVFCLSPNNNIGEAFRRFGITEDATRHLIVLKVGGILDAEGKEAVTAESVERHLSEHVKGEKCAFDDENMRELRDLAKVRKVYKLPAVVSASGKGKGSSKAVVVEDVTTDVDEARDLEVQVIGLMALRGAA